MFIASRKQGWLVFLVGLIITSFLVVNGSSQQSSDNPNPVAYFTHSPFKMIVGEQIVFDARTSKGDIRKYEWDYNNDGSIDQITDFPFGTWFFTKPGLVMVRLKITDKKFHTAQAIYGMMVYETSQRPGPLVTFTASQEPKTYNIIFSPQIQSVGIQPSYYIWDFGDGNQSYIRLGEKVTHHYKQDGIYRVFLRTCSGEDRCHETARVINVKYQIEQGGLGAILIVILFMVAYSCVASLCF